MPSLTAATVRLAADQFLRGKNTTKLRREGEDILITGRKPTGTADLDSGAQGGGLPPGVPPSAAVPETPVPSMRTDPGEAPPGVEPAPLKEAEPELEPMIAEEQLVGRESYQNQRNINFDRMDATDRAKLFINNIAEQQEGFMEQRRGVRTFEDMQQGARTAEVQREVADLIGRPPGTAWNAEQLVAGRELVLGIAEDIGELSERIVTTGGTPEDQAKLIRLHETMGLVQRALQGGIAEAGRALGSMRIVAKASTPERLAQANEMIQEAGGAKNVQKLAALYNKADKNPRDISRNNAALNHTLGHKITRAVMEYWVNSILSGVPTHAVNILGNSLVQAYETGFVKPVAVTAGMVRKTFGGKDDRMYMSELPAEFIGKIQGITDTFIAMGMERRDYFDRVLQGGATKMENPKYRAISAGYLAPNLNPQGMAAKTIDAAGSIVRIPGAMLGVTDDVFQSMIYRGQLTSMAIRRVANRKLPYDEAVAELEKLLANPDAELHAAALGEARRLTFTETQHGKGGILAMGARGLQVLTEKYPAFKVFAPFIKTPANIAQFTLENSILAPMTKKWRQDFFAGGARTDAAVARLSLAVGSTAAIYNMAGGGMVTGQGPKDWKQREVLERTGWRPNSVLINGKYIKYDRMDPIGSIVGMIADAHDMVQYSESDADAADIIYATFGGVLQNFSGKTYLQGVSDFFGLFGGGKDFQSAIEQKVKSTAGGVIPFSSFVAGIRRGADEYVRDTRNVEDSWINVVNGIKNRIPGYSDTLPAKLDWRGDPIIMTGHWTARTMSPIQYGVLKGDDASVALVDNGVKAPKPSHIVFPASLELNLLTSDPTGHVYNKFQEFVGKARAKRVDLLMTETFKEQPDGLNSPKADKLQEAIREGLSSGRQQFMGWYIQNMADNPTWQQLTPEEIARVVEHGIRIKQAHGEGKQEGALQMRGVQKTGLVPEGIKKRLSEPQSEMPRFR